MTSVAFNKYFCKAIDDYSNNEKENKMRYLSVLRGACCYRKASTEYVETNTGEKIKVDRNRWVVDTNIPIFTQDRGFIEKWI